MYINGRAVHRANPQSERELQKELENTKVQLYVSSTDHNENHLRHALKRDKRFKEAFSKWLHENKEQEKLLVFYERDANMFLAECRCRQGSLLTVLTGKQYLSLVQSTEEGFCVTLYRHNQ